MGLCPVCRTLWCDGRAGRRERSGPGVCRQSGRRPVLPVCPAPCPASAGLWGVHGPVPTAAFVGVNEEIPPPASKPMSWTCRQQGHKKACLSLTWGDNREAAPKFLLAPGVQRAGAPPRPAPPLGHRPRIQCDGYDFLSFPVPGTGGIRHGWAREGREWGAASKTTALGAWDGDGKSKALQAGGEQWKGAPTLSPPLPRAETGRRGQRGAPSLPARISRSRTTHTCSGRATLGCLPPQAGPPRPPQSPLLVPFHVGSQFGKGDAEDRRCSLVHGPAN